MATPLDRAKASNAWDARYDLPLCPGFNNPWLYMAYMDVLLSHHGEKLDRAKIYAHFLACEKAVKNVPPQKGCFARWPHGSDQTSHDEIIGAAYFSPDIAKRILTYLDASGGVMDSNGDAAKNSNPLRYNVYRMPWLRPYLCAAAGYDLNIFQQALSCGQIVTSAIASRSKGNAGGRLRDWLMMQKLQRFSAARAATWYWVKKMNDTEKDYCTLKGSLFLEPGTRGDGKPAFRIFSELAPSEWIMPNSK